MDNETQAQPVLDAAKNFYAYATVAAGIMSACYITGVMLGASYEAVKEVKARRRLRKIQSQD